MKRILLTVFGIAALALAGSLDELAHAIKIENEILAEPARPYLGGEARLIRAIQSIVVPEMLGRVRVL